MGKIVLGGATSHGPMLSMPPEMWPVLGDGDKHHSMLIDVSSGRPVTYEELLELADPAIAKRLTKDVFEAQHDVTQKAIATLGRKLREVAPDVVIIVSNDQDEVYFDDNMPCFSIYWGDSVRIIPRNPDDFVNLAWKAALWGYGDVELDVPVDAALGKYLVEYLIEDGFDVAHSRYLKESSGGTIGPAGYIHRPRVTKPRPMGLPHGFSFVVRRLMDNQPIPIVPIWQNTFYPPNTPTIRRCYAFGQALRAAVEAWDSDKRVAILASGGLSHFVVDEEIDELTIKGVREKDIELLASLPRHKLLAGSSENKDWVTVAGAMEPLDFKLIDYVPAYRSPAGTGHADGFAIWE